MGKKHRIINEHGQFVDFPIESLKEAIDSEHISPDALDSHLKDLEVPEQTFKNKPKEKTTYYQQHCKQKKKNIKEEILNKFGK